MLTLLLSDLEPSLVFGQYEEAMHRALGHPAPCVKQFVINEASMLSDAITMEKNWLVVFISFEGTVVLDGYYVNWNHGLKRAWYISSSLYFID